jgi:hypothetical protein
MGTFKLALISIVIAIVLFLAQKQKHLGCNNPGSIAEQVNFGEKNCN